MPKRDALKDRIAEIFTEGQDFSDQMELSVHAEAAIQLDKRVRELNCLNDIGHKIDEQPPLDECLKWVTERIPTAMQYPEACTAVIEYQGHVFGNPAAREISNKIVGGIRVADELFGWLYVAYTQPHSFIDSESALIGGIVSRVGWYIHNLHQKQEAERRARELTILNQMALDMTSVMTLDALVDLVYTYTAKLTDVTNYFLALYDENRQMVEFPIAFSGGERIKIDPRPLGKSLTDHIIRSGQPLLLSERVVEQAEALGIQLVLFGKPVPAESWLGVPIIYANKVLGVIAVQSVTTPGMYTEYDQEVLTNIARSTAHALALTKQYQENLILIDEIRSKARREQALREITTQVRGLMDPGLIMQTAVRELGRTIKRKTYIILGEQNDQQSDLQDAY